MTEVKMADMASKSRPLVAHSDQQRGRDEASVSCSGLQLGWALHKPRSQAVRFIDEVKQ